MKQAIEIAKNAIRLAYPNPAVGCVIVHQNTIIGQGFTSPYGGPHAEVNAIASVENKSLLKDSDLYVTLEPCSHFGKTPPCANLIIEHQIPRVFIGLKDPNPQVAGKGITLLENNLIEVSSGVLEEECKEHHKKFLCFQLNKRPYIILKWAETSDGFIAPTKAMRTTNPEPYWISSPSSRERVHLWRSKEHAILIGANTLREDNPSLTVRHTPGSNPIPIVIDPKLSITTNHQLFHNKDLILITDKENLNRQDEFPFQVEAIDFSKNVIPQLLDKLYQLNILSVFVEGGSFTLYEFIQSNLWDEARIIQSKNKFNDGIKAPELNLEPIGIELVDVDQIAYYKNNDQNG